MVLGFSIGSGLFVILAPFNISCIWCIEVCVQCFVQPIFKLNILIYVNISSKFSLTSSNSFPLSLNFQLPSLGKILGTPYPVEWFLGFANTLQPPLLIVPTL